ncbi:MAG: MFS transporter [Acidobacteria bacterium]|nr:MAG: MFS transporter [Acidobacteriota bacterium]
MSYSEAQLHARKITWTLSIAHALSSTGFLASATITSIVGADLSGRTAWAGVPSAVYQLGVAAAALVLGYTMDRLGRRRALSMGFLIGACGAALATWAIVARTFVGFLGALALMGPASAAAGLSRFVAAEVHPVHERGRAIATVVVGGTAGTLIWPLLSVTLGPWLAGLHLSDLVWPFGVSMVLLALAAIVVAAFLRPDPGVIARALAEPHSHATGTAGGRVASLGEILRRPGASVAIASMVAGHAIMVMVMVITSLHMRNHDHGVAAISITTSLHVLGMFAFSILSGRLADRIGRAPVIMAGAAVLVLACVVAPLSPAFVPITFGLFLLGLGWNLCFVGGSSLLADQLSPDERARTQGFNDLLMGLVAASGSFLSGHVFAAVGYGMMGLFSAAVAVVPFTLALWWQTRARQRLSAG